ncbi:MAG: hypothetical protein V3U18_08685, partial [Alphaproteobacteria bacterium]
MTGWNHHCPIRRRHAAWRRHWRGLPVAALLCVTGASPALADAIAVRAWDHDGYGRIVFDWKGGVEYAVRLEGRNLVVRFERPMTASFEQVLARLGKYVTGARLEDGGRKAVFTLAQGLDHRSFISDGSVVVDLLDRPRGTAGLGIRRPLAVRVGEHPGFSRVVFDWTRPVEYRILRDGATATVSFDVPARIDLDKLRADLPDRVKAVDLAANSSGLAVHLTISEAARLRHFRSGARIVIDVLGPAGPRRPSGESVKAGVGRPTTGSPVALAPAKSAPAPATKPSAASPRSQSRNPDAAGRPGALVSDKRVATKMAGGPAQARKPGKPDKAQDRPAAARPGALVPIKPAGGPAERHGAGNFDEAQFEPAAGEPVARVPGEQPQPEGAQARGASKPDKAQDRPAAARPGVLVPIKSAGGPAQARGASKPDEA